MLCNDSHRALDTPNVYWQCHLTCPDFDVSGATFPGLPGFPHFGFNGSVAWAITHGDADTQDLYLERFSGNGASYLTETVTVTGDFDAGKLVEAFEDAGFHVKADTK